MALGSIEDKSIVIKGFEIIDKLPLTLRICAVLRNDVSDSWKTDTSP